MLILHKHVGDSALVGELFEFFVDGGTVRDLVQLYEHVIVVLLHEHTLGIAAMPIRKQRGEQ
jgi:hypothetical protein